MANIGKNIKNARIKKNMRQEDLASRLYVTRTTVSNYETNHSNPDIETLQQIAEILDTDVNTLIYGEKKDAFNRKPIYIMMIILMFVLILLGPVSYMIESASNNIVSLTYNVPIAYIIWGINITDLLRITCAAVIVYLFLYTLQIGLPYAKGRKIISYLMIIFCLLYLINTILYYSKLITWSLWLEMYMISDNLSTWLAVLYGILFGICSYQTLFFQNTYGRGEEKIREWFNKKKWIILGSFAAIVVLFTVFTKVTMKESVIYGTVSTKSTNNLSFDVDKDKTDLESLEDFYNVDGYSLDMSTIENIDDVKDSLKKGDAIKLVIQDYFFEFQGKKWYIYMEDE